MVVPVFQAVGSLSFIFAKLTSKMAFLWHLAKDKLRPTAHALHPLPFSLGVSFALWWVSCWQHIAGFCCYAVCHSVSWEWGIQSSKVIIRILEWVAISSSRRSCRPRDRTRVFYIAGGFFTVWVTREAQISPYGGTIQCSAPNPREHLCIFLKIILWLFSP